MKDSCSVLCDLKLLHLPGVSKYSINIIYPHNVLSSTLSKDSPVLISSIALPQWVHLALNRHIQSNPNAHFSMIATYISTMSQGQSAENVYICDCPSMFLSILKRSESGPQNKVRKRCIVRFVQNACSHSWD